jgi:hypothetical protein
LSNAPGACYLLRMRLAIALLLALAACDRKPPERTSPESAFARIAPCVDRGSAACLFRELDRDSRWSTGSIHRLLGEVRELVDRSYPADRRSQAYGTWAAEARAADPAGLFETYCAERRCLSQLARGFGAVTEVTDRTASRARVHTTRGASFPMACADGEWGLATFREELKRAKIHLGDVLAQVRRNAAAYDDQRIVSGGEGNPQ